MKTTSTIKSRCLTRPTCFPVAFLLLTAFLIPWQHLAAAPVIRCGKITNVAYPVDKVNFIDMEKALRRGLLKHEKSPPSSLITSKTPQKEGMTFAVLTVRLKTGHSIGRYDYKLQISAESYPCLALAGLDGPFDPRMWQQRARMGITKVRLLFEVPSGIKVASLQAALTPALEPEPTTVRLAGKSDSSSDKKDEKGDDPAGEKDKNGESGEPDKKEEKDADAEKPADDKDDDSDESDDQEESGKEKDQKKPADKTEEDKKEEKEPEDSGDDGGGEDNPWL